MPQTDSTPDTARTRIAFTLRLPAHLVQQITRVAERDGHPFAAAVRVLLRAGLRADAALERQAR